MRLYYPGCTVSTAARACPDRQPDRRRSENGIHDVLRSRGHLRAGFGGRLCHYADSLSRHGKGHGEQPLSSLDAMDVYPRFFPRSASALPGMSSATARPRSVPASGSSTTSAPRKSPRTPPVTRRISSTASVYFSIPRQGSGLGQHRRYHADRPRRHRRQPESPGQSTTAVS